MSTMFIILILSANNIQCSNILYVSVIPSRSHYLWNGVLSSALANKGHNVTHLTADKDEAKSSNYSQIYVEGTYETLHRTVDFRAVSKHTLLQNIFDFAHVSGAICKSGLKSGGVQQLLNYPFHFKFDLIIIDATLGTCFYPLIHRFNYPATISVTTLLLPTSIAFSFGNHLQPAYVPWYGLPYTSDMTFMQRFWNHLFTYVDIIIKNIYQRKLERETTEKVFGKNVPSKEKLERHISLLFANTDPILDNPQALAPNIIPVGGLHIKNAQELPKDMEAIVAGAENGIIVFSLGSILRSDRLDKRLQRCLLEAFSHLQETVIWKFESEIENLPENIVVRKWLPQADLLGKANVKLFIGHGGTLSSQEAIYHGVPMICIPFIIDQLLNAKNIADRKLGISLDYKTITADYMVEKIREVVENPVYSENVKTVSRRYKDRVETPLERAIFWVEYAIRHDGANFLNTRARDLAFYEILGLDVLAFLILVFVVVCITSYTVIRFIVSKFQCGVKLKTN